MAGSSALRVSYDLRPAKQTERRIILDLVKLAGDLGYNLTKYRYIGMGGNRFYDFLLFHKYIGINNMVSLEEDHEMYQRAQFNCPYDFIDVKNCSVFDFISEDNFNEPNILWLDYDGCIGIDMFEDIAALSTKLNLGDMCFVTAAGKAPGVLKEMNARERLDWLREYLNDVAGDVVLEDVSNNKFPTAVHKMLVTSFKSAFATKTGCVFEPLIQIKYADGAVMVTVGGLMVDVDKQEELRKKLSETIPFLPINSSEMYSINVLNLTERERMLFDTATSKRRKYSKESNQLLKIGFDQNDLKSYEDLVRYLPRYFESIL